MKAAFSGCVPSIAAAAANVQHCLSMRRKFRLNELFIANEHRALDSRPLRFARRTFLVRSMLRSNEKGRGGFHRRGLYRTGSKKLVQCALALRGSHRRLFKGMILSIAVFAIDGFVRERALAQRVRENFID